MGRLGGFSGREAMKVAEALGWEHDRTNGDHYIYKKDGVTKNASIPDHRSIKEGTLRDIVRTLGVTPDEFIRRARGQPR